MNQSAECWEIPISQPAAASYMSFGLLIGLLVATWVISEWRTTPLAVSVAGLILSVGGLGIAIRCLMLLLDSRPGLVLSPEGILVSSQVGTGSLIPWTDINDLRLMKFSHHWQLWMKVGNPERYAAGHGRLYRAMYSYSSSALGVPIRVDLTFLRCDRQVLLKRAQEMCERFGSLRRDGKKGTSAVTESLP